VLAEVLEPPPLELVLELPLLVPAWLPAIGVEGPHDVHLHGLGTARGVLDHGRRRRARAREKPRCHHADRSKATRHCRSPRCQLSRPRSAPTRARCHDPPRVPPARAARPARAAPRVPLRAAAAGRSASGAPGSDRLRDRRTTPPRYQPSRLLRKPNGTPTA